MTFHHIYLFHIFTTSGATAVPSLEFDRLFCCNCFGRRWRTAEHTPVGVTVTGMDRGRHAGGDQVTAGEPQAMRLQPDIKETQQR